MLETVLQSAKSRGFITGEEVLHLYPEVEEYVHLVDEMFAKLIEEGVAVMIEGEDICQALEMPAEADLESSSVTVELVEVTVTEVLVEEEVEDPLAAEEPLPTDLDLEQEEVFVTSATQVDLDDISADDTVSLYLKQMGQVPLLTAVEEVTLARQIEDGDRAQTRMRDRALGGEMRSELSFVVNLGNQARTKLVEANTRLVVSVAKRYIGQGVNFLDLIQEGNIGLMKAVEKFDYHRGYKFSTYATWWIRQGITRALAQQSRLIRLPVHAGDQIRRIYRIAEQLEQETGRRPTPEEIAEKTGLGALKVERLLRISRYPVSLERPVGDDGDTEFGDFIEDEDSPPPADIAYQRLLREALDDVMTSLSAREARILRLRFGLRDGRPHTLEEVGEKFGLTRERIRQIEHQALARLRHPHRSKQLRDYLR
jgi:RNA polymerase primary sigma factor